LELVTLDLSGGR